MPIRCVLFDFDGVIADTEERNADYLASALAHFGVRLTDADRSALVGINDPSLLEALLKRAETPVTLEQLQAERTRHGNYYENGADLHTQPGLREFLSALRAQGIRTGVVSSTRSQLILTALDRLHLVSQFDVVVCGDMVTRRKPDPEPYLRAAQLLGLAPGDCLVIEDSPTGIRAGKAAANRHEIGETLRAGKAAGCTVLGYTGSSIRQDVSAADFALSDFHLYRQIPLFQNLSPF